MELSLIDAFGRYGATPDNRLHGLSALAVDGALVLNCSQSCFVHPAQGVLHYEDRLSRERDNGGDFDLLGQHLTLARDGALPVRMVVAFQSKVKAAAVRRYHVRPDLVGKVVQFDGDHFIVDFRRQEEGGGGAVARRR